MEMISLRTAEEIEKLRAAGRITAQARALAESLVKPGVSTYQIDREVRRFIQSKGAKPSFLGLYGFPASICASVNECVIHGIPSREQVLREGDIVSIDVGACLNGYHGDCAGTFLCGAVSGQAKKLVEVTKESFFQGIRQAHPGNRVRDIGAAVQKYVEGFGFSVVRDFVGHGVGREMHEPPEVPNYGPAGHGPRLMPGMVLAVEPMVCAGDWRVENLDGNWTTVTVDRSLAAHYENTILITEGEPEILTDPGDGHV